MPPSSKSTGKTASRAQPVRRRPAPKPRLNGAMACDTAFRIVARRHLDALVANREATANGDPTALHQMRIALTHLRTAILFFSPMVDDAMRDEVRDELKWLNGELGAVRDLDVAVDRMKELKKKRPQILPAVGAWSEKRSEGHRTLSRMLQSVRYQWLIDQTSGWIENGPWSTKTGQAVGNGTRQADRRLHHRQAPGMGGIAARAQPQAAQDGNEEAASPAPSQQEADLFHRFLRGSVRRQEIRKAEGGAEAVAQGAALAWPAQ